ncbi:MAG: hypothetical protein Q4C95_11120 [Planctomycetia bacterium]|nr:hypothetical protein [Planctomycetia bacterium]
MRRTIDLAPFMPGVDFLTVELFRELGTELIQKVLPFIHLDTNGLNHFFQYCAPLLHEIGTVRFHLAESKTTPERPFCFWVTYTTNLPATGSVQHKPLGRALFDFADETSALQSCSTLRFQLSAFNSQLFSITLLKTGKVQRCKRLTFLQAML